MDNITHSLVGVALAELALTLGPQRERAAEVRPAYWLISVLANNFPDIDLLWAGPLDGKLGYLLHHRGHSHTLAWVLPQILLVLALFGVLRRMAPRWTGGVDTRDKAGLLLLALLGPLVHLGMDSWNLYGIHPYWPLDPAWRYGDRVFIVEPWIWVLLMPVAACAPGVGGRLRAILALLFGGLLALGGASGLLGPWELGLLGAGALGGLLTARTLGPKAPAFALALLLIGTHELGKLSAATKRLVTRRLPAPPHDVIVSPSPADPNCWVVMTVEADPARDLYRVRRGALSYGVQGVEAAACFAPWDGPTTAPLQPPDLPSDPVLAWGGQFEAPLSELRRLRAEHCRFAAFLRFARAPFWLQDEGGRWVYGDVRFDRGTHHEFSEILDPEGSEADCEGLWVPGWGEPVGELAAPRRYLQNQR